MTELEAWKQATKDYTESHYEFQGNRPAYEWIEKRAKKLLKEFQKSTSVKNDKL